jgi:uncharacterized membrane protein
MAGIGFELRKLLGRGSYSEVLKTYAYAGLISSGPWVLSILAVMLLGLLSLQPWAGNQDVDAFLISITYLVASSLIITGLIQLLLTRFIADQLYEHKHDQVVPNLNGALLLVNLLGGLVGAAALFTLFPGRPVYAWLMLSGFMLLSNIWILTILLTSLKNYTGVLMAYGMGYGCVLLTGLALQNFGIEGLLAAFVLGQGLLVIYMLWLILKEYPADEFIAWDFLNPKLAHYSLMAIGFLFNLGIWADKLLFWLNPATSQPIIGSLRASPLYDLPLFLAYLSILPGMAVFLVRLETDFAEAYEGFFNHIRRGATLAEIEQQRQQMVESVRLGIYEIFKIQGITILLLMLLGPKLFKWLGFSNNYIPLFNVDLIAVGLQVLLLALLNVLFYLDRLRAACGLCALFAISNFLLTYLSQQLGPAYYGLGFAMAILISTIATLWVLSQEMHRLTYQTFMLQR